MRPGNDCWGFGHEIFFGEAEVLGPSQLQSRRAAGQMRTINASRRVYGREHVAPIRSGDDLHDDRRISRVASDRPVGDGQRQRGRGVIRRGHATDRGVQADHAAQGRRQPRRASAIRADGNRHHGGCDRRRRSGTGRPRHCLGIPRIARMVSKVGHPRGDAHAGHNGNAEDDGARLAQSLGRDRIFGGWR
jgi:hypothetical protein